MTMPPSASDPGPSTFGSPVGLNRGFWVRYQVTMSCSDATVAAPTSSVVAIRR